jgi:hypothetical protein
VAIFFDEMSSALSERVIYITSQMHRRHKIAAPFRRRNDNAIGACSTAVAGAMLADHYQR